MLACSVTTGKLFKSVLPCPKREVGERMPVAVVAFASSVWDAVSALPEQ